MGYVDVFPPLETCLELGREELAVILLKQLHKLQQQNESIHLGNYLNVLSQYERGYAKGKDVELQKAITEAWLWLQMNGMLAPRPDQSNKEFLYITKHGEELLAHGDIGTYLRSHYIFPKGSLDSAIERRVIPLFIRGDLDTAVFTAFKEVEVRVREAAGLPNESYGVALMREAFHPEKGPLADRDSVSSERQATSDLYAGAIGLLKNPSSHRNVDWADAVECAGLIFLANYLLCLLKKRTEQHAGTTKV